MFKVRYKGRIYTVYHVEPRPILQFLDLCGEAECVLNPARKSSSM